MMDTLYLAQLIMYFVFIFSIIAYTTLDGFDLGVGCLHLFSKGDQERRLMINAIGPVWDGNSTWIVIGGGVLFAAFPKAFATLTPNLYTPFMLILFGFMLRAAAIEFRSKGHQQWWTRTWDISFFLASLTLTFMVGLVLGNLIQGLPLNNQGVLEGGLSALLTPYTLLIALFGISCFVMHGALFLLMKTEGPFHDKVRRWAHRATYTFLTLWLLASVATFLKHPHMVDPFLHYPIIAICPFLSFIAIISILVFLRRGSDGLAFLASCLAIFFLLALFAIGTFPNIAYSSLDPAGSLSLTNSSASELALWIMVGVTLTGVPLAFFYFPYIYKVFKGKVVLDSHSY
jgi:cytochrome bd ubiquinol oxidase subunit II